VVVSLNHRLNIFGFLSLGAFDPRYAESGNAGLLDLVLALQWVQENVAAFGGDPDRVTLMGESGGGMKISHLLAMECAKGLFHRAIVESGSYIVGDLSPETATRRAREALEKLGIGEGELEKLANVPAEKLLAIAKEMELEVPLLGFRPVADDIVIPSNKGRGFYVPACSADIPLMVGASEDECGLALILALPGEVDSLGHLKDWLISSKDPIWGAGGYLTEENTEKVIQIFQQASRTEKSLWHLGAHIVSQVSFLGRGAYFQAEAKAKRNAAPVYQYLVAYDTATFVLPHEKASWHTADLPLQFRQVYIPEQEALSRAMAHAWAAFARTGNPSTDEVRWEPFTLETRQIMVFDEQGARMETDPLQLPREVITEIIEARENKE
jgi:para-nitrobenzyl esterase